MQYLHTMVRVRDLDAALDFYCDKLGLEQVSEFRVQTLRIMLASSTADFTPILSNTRAR